MLRQSLLVIALLTLPASFALADWPNYRGPSGNSTVEKTTIEKIANVRELWKAPLGDSFGQIAVAGDKAFAFIKRDDGEVAIGLDAKTGKELWKTSIDRTISDRQGGDGPRTTPAIDGDNVFIYGTYGKLFCLNSATGKTVWQQDVATEGRRTPVSGIQWGNAASPVIVGDLVIVVGGGAGKGILAYNKKTGDNVWAKTNEVLTHATPTVATIHNVQQVICFMQSGLVSIDPKTGDTLWKFAHPYSTSTAASPVVGGKKGDIVYCSASYGVGAAACRVSKDGANWKSEELWRTKGQNTNHWSTPVHHNGYIYGLFGRADDNGPLGCLDIETGLSKWSKGNFGTKGALILVGDHLLVQTPKGELVLVDATPEKYDEVDRKKILPGKNWTMPSYSDGKIFARNTAEVVCLEIPAK